MSDRKLGLWWSARGAVARATLGGLAALLVVACGGSDVIDLPDGAATAPDAGPEPDAGPRFRDAGAEASSLRIDRVAPDHGPFTGFNQVVLRGAGFTVDSRVSFGTQNVQPADHQVLDERRLAVLVPRGNPGVVDVSVTDGDAVFTLPDAYRYESISVDPSSGAIAGGTFVTITGEGTAFEEDDEVFFGRGRCTDVAVVSATRITCRTPAGAAGSVPVSIARGGITQLTAEDAYTYFDSADPLSGGLGGGAIGSSVNITALNAQNGDPIPDAFVIVGDDLDTELQGFTDALGQITLSGPALVPPITVHISKFCFEATTFEVFDARDVTARMIPWQDLRCGDPGPPPPGGGLGRNGAQIRGELIWPSDIGLGPQPWFNLPEPREGWRRSARVYRARTVLADPTPPAAPPPPAIVFEDDPEALGENGYLYDIELTYPGGAAVYAIAGLESTDPENPQFIPYIMGVARNVLAGPGETVDGVDITMDIPLDHFLEVQLSELPDPVASGPDRFRVQANIDLGGEGFIVSDQFVDNPFDVLRSPRAVTPFRFAGTPALSGALVDGRFRIEAGWFSLAGTQELQPLTAAVETGVREVDTTVEIGGFLGIPEPVAPTSFGDLPSDRTLRWETDGPEPSFYLLLLQGLDGTPLWRFYTPGDVTEAVVPDLEGIGVGEDLIEDLPATFQWAVFAITIPGFDFNEFRYTYLNDRFWERWSIDAWIARNDAGL